MNDLKDMTIHKEGYRILAAIFIFLVLIDFILFILGTPAILMYIIVPVTMVFFFFVSLFFRCPKRTAVISSDQIIAPADGEIVIIEEVEEPEYFKDRRLQVSIFMSAYNVHVNWFPIGGIISYFKYHPGRYIVAWHPKSSEKNERTSIVIRHTNGKEIMLRQIAGYVARRIVSYAEVNRTIAQCDQLGFIKFGSRIDLFLPLDSKLMVRKNEKVTGSQTIIADLN